MSKKFSEMTKAEQDAALSDTFDAMNGDGWCSIHDTATIANSNGDIGEHCPVCLAESQKADAERIAKMNADTAFADWHSKTDR